MPNWDMTAWENEREERVFKTMPNSRLKIVPAMKAFQCPAYARYFYFAGLCDKEDVGEHETTFQVYGERNGFDRVVYLR